jgi:hypothetical protein
LADVVDRGNLRERVRDPRRDVRRRVARWRSEEPLAFWNLVVRAAGVAVAIVALLCGLIDMMTGVVGVLPSFRGRDANAPLRVEGPITIVMAPGALVTVVPPGGWPIETPVPMRPPSPTPSAAVPQATRTPSVQIVDFRFTSDIGEPFRTESYECTSSLCDGFVSRIHDSGTDTGLQYQMDVGRGGDLHFVEYHYAECYLPLAFLTSIGTGTALGPWDHALEFRKGEDCAARVLAIDAPSEVAVGATFRVTAEVGSYAGLPEGIGLPPDMRMWRHYSAEVDAYLYVDDEPRESKQLLVLFGATNTVEFEYTPTEAGTLRLSVWTIPEQDCKCESAVWQHRYHTVTVTAG